MKKLLLIMLLPLAAFAQDEPAFNKFRFSISGGVALSDAYVPVNYENRQSVTKNKTSFYGGVNAEYFISEKTSLNAGAFYVTTGASRLGETLDNIEVSMVKIPITAKYYVNNSFYVDAGMYLAPITDVAYKTYSGQTEGVIDHESLDYGFEFGIGGVVSNFFIEAAVTIGMKDLVSYDKSYFLEYDPIVNGTINDSNMFFKNRIYQIGIGYKF